LTTVVSVAAGLSFVVGAAGSEVGSTVLAGAAELFGAATVVATPPTWSVSAPG
jgi:hypothetical protein